MHNTRGNRPQQYSRNSAYTPRNTQRNTGTARTAYTTGSSYTKPNAFLSALLYIATIFSLCVFIGLLVLRTANIPTIVSNIIQDTNVAGILETYDDAGYIVNQINGLPFIETHISHSELEEFIKRDAVSNEIGCVVDEYAKAFANGDLDHHITTDDIVDISKKLEPELQELFNHQMTEDNYDYLAKALDDVLDLNSLSVGGLMEDFEVDTTIPSLLLSPILLWTVGFLCAVFLFFIFLLRSRNIPEASLAVGIPIAIAGFITFLAGLMINASPGLFGETIQRFLKYLTNPISLLTQYGFTFAAIGVLIILISIMFNRATQRG